MPDTNILIQKCLLGELQIDTGKLSETDKLRYAEQQMLLNSLLLAHKNIFRIINNLKQNQIIPGAELNQIGKNRV